MEKLKRDEIRALARVIKKEYNSPKDNISSKEIDTIFNSKEIINLNTYIGKVKSKFKGLLSDYNYYTITKTNVRSYLSGKNKGKYYSEDEIVDMITLEQIEAKDLDSLKKAIVSKLK